MHEYSIVSALIAQVDDAAHKHIEPSVLQVRIRVGTLAGVEPTLLRTAWELFREGTCCSRAELDVVQEPARWACPTCEAAIEPGDVLRCPHCGVPAHRIRGDALVLERIEMEVGHV